MTIADARFAKPFDRALVTKLIETHKALLIVEESSPGGFSAHLLQFAANEGLLRRAVRFALPQLPMTISTMQDAPVSSLWQGLTPHI